MICSLIAQLARHPHTSQLCNLVVLVGEWGLMTCCHMSLGATTGGL